MNRGWQWDSPYRAGRRTAHEGVRRYGSHQQREPGDIVELANGAGTLERLAQPATAQLPFVQSGIPSFGEGERREQALWQGRILHASMVPVTCASGPLAPWDLWEAS
ncbi:hypothetical protein GCM10025774_09430 [Microbacterium kyungheense]